MLPMSLGLPAGPEVLSEVRSGDLEVWKMPGGHEEMEANSGLSSEGVATSTFKEAAQCAKTEF